MNIQESCKKQYNDTHLVSISFDENDIAKLIEGKVVHIDCAKTETQIYIGKDIV
tara:strand:+ start:23 stop:184 length:162 start_codon:yes stop_codon:yes gene_type:complete